VIINSRSREEWLGPTRRFELKLGGLDGEERWEYCEIILRELGLNVDRNDSALAGLMDQLAGHPLAMRVVLPKVAEMGAAKVATALRTNIAELGLSEQEEQGRLFGTLRFVEQGLAAELRSLLGLVGLHEGFVDADYLEAMAKQVDAGWTRERIDRFLAVLGAAGLVRDVGNAIHEMHPLLTSYLRSRGPAPEAFERAFVDVLARLADVLGPRELHEHRVPFLRHGANFQYALGLAERLAMDEHLSALTQSLAVYAQRLRRFGEASRLFEGLAKHCAAKENLEGEAAAYHQLGTIAQGQWDSATAREWYLKSLAISEKRASITSPPAPITNWASSPRSRRTLRRRGSRTSNPSRPRRNTASVTWPPAPIINWACSPRRRRTLSQRGSRTANPLRSRRSMTSITSPPSRITNRAGSPKRSGTLRRRGSGTLNPSPSKKSGATCTANGPMLFLAGFLSTGRKWEEFRKHWQVFIDSCPVKIPYFHMTECLATGEALKKSMFRDLSDRQRQDLAKRAVGITRRWVEAGVVVSVNTEEFNREAWAVHGRYNPPAGNQGRQCEVAALLVSAGAKVASEWLESERVRADPAMLAALRARR
jgi:hypothetical protein